MKTALALSLLLVGCATEPTDTTDLDSDSATAGTRNLICNLEYEAFSPTFATAPAGSFDAKQTDVNHHGATAGDGTYELDVSVNPTPTTNLSFNAVIGNTTTGATVSYIVLPAVHTGGDYLFELGGKIDPITPPNATRSFDFLRAYCSLVYE